MTVKKQNEAFSTIELLFAIAIFGLVFTALFVSLSLSFKVSAINKSKVGAIAILNKEVEQIRAMKYENIGLPGHEPAGSLLANKSETLNAVTYDINTQVFWVDDPKDGLQTNGTDSDPQDYKAVKLRALWTSHNKNYSYERTIYVYK